jgi:hypothetical protein
MAVTVERRAAEVGRGGELPGQHRDLHSRGFRPGWQETYQLMQVKSSLNPRCETVSASAPRAELFSLAVSHRKCLCEDDPENTKMACFMLFGCRLNNKRPSCTILRH